MTFIIKKKDPYILNLSSSTFVMKIINKKSVRKSGVDKFFGEVSILRELDHPNIVKFKDVLKKN